MEKSPSLKAKLSPPRKEMIEKVLTEDTSAAPAIDPNSSAPLFSKKTEPRMKIMENTKIIIA
jgi:hypothetical protein